MSSSSSSYHTTSNKGCTIAQTSTPFNSDVDDIESRFWKVGNAESQPDHVEERSLQVTVLSEKGQSLEACKDSADLIICVGHALLGYLIALLKGYMHRDTSIGNLLRLFNEVDRKPFSAKSVVELLRASRNDTETATDDVSTWTSIEELASGDAEKKRLVDNAKALERALQTLNISDKCRAVWSDADMAANLNNYFERERNKSQVSGTEEFQSWEMRYAIEQKEPYAHSPLDDLHSFFWTTLCATTNNKNQVSEKKDESVWRRNLRGTWSDREGVMFAFSMCNMDSSYSPMLVNMQSFMGAWKIKIDKLLKEGHAKAAELSQSAENTGDDILDMYKRLMFRGVQEYFDLILEHKESLGLSV